MHAAVVVSGFSRTSRAGGPATTNDVGFQSAGGRGEDDGVDEAADRFGGLRARVGMLKRLREVGHLLPVELRQSRMQKRGGSSAESSFACSADLRSRSVPFGLQVLTGEPVNPEIR